MYPARHCVVFHVKKDAKRFGGNEKSRTFALPFEKQGCLRHRRGERNTGQFIADSARQRPLMAAPGEYPGRTPDRNRGLKKVKKSLEIKKKALPLQTRSGKGARGAGNDRKFIERLDNNSTSKVPKTMRASIPILR